MNNYGGARLVSRPAGVIVREMLGPGVHTVKMKGRRDSLLFVPKVRSVNAEMPLAISLHGAGGNEEHGLSLLREEAEEHGFCVLAPRSLRDTWDVIVGAYGPDVESLDAALAYVFARLHVQASRLAISGFSDGASYALSLGLANGGLFPHVIAFSPGFMRPPAMDGKPRVYVSHGTKDSVLPIERCSRVISSRLRRMGYELSYREFDGPHTVPGDIKQEAVRWWLS